MPFSVFEMPVYELSASCVPIEECLYFSRQTHFQYLVTRFVAGPRKTILHGLSGEFRAGHLSAIMGPSGAGKSSLMNVVTGFKRPTAGVLTANGKVRNEREFRKASCYIAQEDLLQPLLTTKESMMLAARLKLSNQVIDVRAVLPDFANYTNLSAVNSRTKM